MSDPLNLNDPLMMALSGGLGQQANPMQNALMGGWQPQNQPQQPNFGQRLDSTFAGMPTNPLMGAAMGALSAGFDDRINPSNAIMQGMMNAQMMKNRTDVVKQREDALKLSQQQQKIAHEQRMQVSKLAAEGLKNLDVDGDNNISPEEKTRGTYLRLATQSGDPQWLKQAEETIAPKNKFGSGLEGSALALYLKNKDNPEWMASAEGNLTSQLLTRGRPTPMGMVPGLDLGGTGGTPEVTVPKSLTQSEETTRYASGSMVDMEGAVNDMLNATGFDPTSKKNIWAKLPFVGNWLASPEWQQYKAGSDEFATNLVFLRSGATARRDEKDDAFENFWPQPWDKSPAVILFKESLRTQQMLNAYQKGYQEGRTIGPEAEQEMALLQRRAAAAKAKYQQHVSQSGESGVFDGDPKSAPKGSFMQDKNGNLRIKTDDGWRLVDE